MLIIAPRKAISKETRRLIISGDWKGLEAKVAIKKKQILKRKRKIAHAMN